MNLVIIWSLILITTAEGFNESVRHRRDDLNDRLDILKIRYHHGDRIHLVTLRRALNSNMVDILLLQIKMGTHTESYSPYLNRRILPIFYHGTISFSAVTYYPRTGTLHGVIDEQFYIENLPLHRAYDPDSVGTFMRTIPRGFSHATNTRHQRGIHKKYEADTGSPPPKRAKVLHPKKTFYPEIFVVVDVPPEQIDSNHTDIFDRATMYLIAYWNAIDMLFRTVKSIDFRINIAIMMIGSKQNLGNFGFVAPEHIRTTETDVFILKNHALEDMRKYFYTFRRFKRSSYDFVVWMTSATLVDAHSWNEEHVDLHKIRKVYTGISSPPADCGGMLLNEHYSNMISNSAIVMYDSKFAQYHTVARELAHLMFVSDDDIVSPYDESHQLKCPSPNPLTQSSGIMDSVNNRLNGYLYWSYCSEIRFEKYSRSQSSCCLINYPILTMDPLKPLPSVSIESQCRCYGMTAHKNYVFRRNFCKENLKCDQGDGRTKEIGLPLYGTPCKAIRSKAICYGQRCHSVLP